jgi:hypothetical protein
MNRDFSFSKLYQDLQGLIDVQSPRSDSLLTSAEFIDRCRLLTPNFHDQRAKRIYVDGFVGKCYSNSCKVYRDELEAGLKLYVGYALAYGRWWEHAWCMIGDLTIETTHWFDAYYGSELVNDECELVLSKYRCSYPPSQSKNVRIYTYECGSRRAVSYNPDIHAAGIGRERDARSGVILEGLGRTKRSTPPIGPSNDLDLQNRTK